MGDLQGRKSIEDVLGLFQGGDTLNFKSSSKDTQGIQDQIDERQCPNSNINHRSYQKVIDSIDHSNEKRRRLSSENPRKSVKSVGEQVSHLMFRKSGLIREHGKKRSQHASSNDIDEAHDLLMVSAEFDQDDVEEYHQTEAKQFFVNRQEQEAKEKQITEILGRKSVDNLVVPDSSQSQMSIEAPCTLMR